MSPKVAGVYLERWGGHLVDLEAVVIVGLVSAIVGRDELGKLLTVFMEGFGRDFGEVSLFWDLSRNKRGSWLVRGLLQGDRVDSISAYQTLIEPCVGSWFCRCVWDCSSGDRMGVMFE